MYGIVAVFLALSAGAYAVEKAPKNSVVSSSIRTGAVKSADVANDGLTGTDIAEGTLQGVEGPRGEPGPPGERGPQGERGPAGSIDGVGATGDLTGTYPGPSIAPNAVGTSEVDGSLTGADIADGSVGTSELSSTAVTPNNLAVTPNDLAAGATTTPFIFRFPISDGVDGFFSAPRDLLVVDAWLVNESSDGGSVFVVKSPPAQLITQLTAGADNAVTRATSINDANNQLASGDTLFFDANPPLDAEVYVLALPL